MKPNTVASRGWGTAILLLAAVLLVVIACAAPVRAATPQQIDEAIAKAKDFLYKHQKNGNWEESPQRDPKSSPYDTKGGQWGGLTAIATYALMASGDDPHSEHVKPAIEWLQTADVVGLYALGMRCQVWELWGLADSTKKTHAIISKLVAHDGNLILSSTKSQGDALGLYDYLLNVQEQGVKWEAGGRWDDSVSQYGVLGVWACAENGFEVPQRYWQAVEEAWLRHQDKSGGWPYDDKAKSQVRASMTAAGIASLFITQDYLHGMEGVECNGNIRNPHIDAGLEWMSKNFDQVFKMGADTTYTLYGVERIGVASGYRYFGTTDWFREGAEHLIKGQGKDGDWNGHGGPIANTAFAILFLERGRAPVLMNKLDYAIDMHGDKPKLVNWNQRPRDAANLAKWMGKETEKFLNWQVVNLKVPSEQLHDSQILYIAGNQALDFTEDEVAKLRQFCEDGGLILINADCGYRAKFFVESITKPGKLASKMFPDYEFRPLPPDHLIFNNQFHFDKPSQKIEVQGLSNGTRELVLLFPTADPARFWQTGAYNGHEVFHDVMINLFLYVTDKIAPRTKDQSYLVIEDPKVKTEHAIKVARLKYPGNWNPEPGGWRRMKALLHNEDKIEMSTEDISLGEGKLTGTFKVAHLTGTSKFHLADAQREELKKFVDDGGTLVVDSAGGSAEFAGAAETELAAIFVGGGEDLKRPLPPTDALFTANGKPIEASIYRALAKHTLLGSSRGPRLRAIRADKHGTVYFSPEDVSVGMVGQEVDGIYGYTPATATAVMQHILVQAAGGDKKPAPNKPAPNKPAPAPPANKPEPAKGGIKK